MDGSGQMISPAAAQPFSAVLRRYSDFLWLYERLHQERAGAVVPALPEKQPVGRFSPQFIEERRRLLEQFLRRVAVHPELSDAPCLDAFLRADDVTFQAAKAAKNQVVQLGTSTASLMMAPSPMQGTSAASPKKEGLKRWFAEAKTAVTGDLVRSPDDDLFEEISRYVAGLDNQMRNVTHQATGLVRKGKEMANGLFEFGLAFNLLGQTEADALGEALQKMGETADKLSVLSAEHAEQEHRQFEEPLQDYVKTVHAVKLALQRRHEKLLTYSTCLSEVEGKAAQLGKLRVQIGSEAKAYQTEMSLRRAQEAAELAQQDFAATSQRVLREVDRFKREKAEEMRSTVLDYIQLQVEYNKRMEEIWATLIPALENVPVSMEPVGPVTVTQQRQQQQQPPPPVTVSPEPGQPFYTNTSSTAPPPPLGSWAPPSFAPPQQQQIPSAPQDPSQISVQYRDPM
jgi:sorting nexin-1/2